MPSRQDAAIAYVAPEEMPAEPGPYATPEKILQWSTQLVAASIKRLTPARLCTKASTLLKQLENCGPKRRWAFKNDITMMCVVLLTRATNLVSVKNRMSDEGKARVTELEQRYALKKGLTSRSLEWP